MAQDGDTSVVSPKRRSPTQQPSAAEQVKIAPEQRSVIYVGSMTVRAKDVTTASDQAKQIVAASGGTLASEESNSYDSGDGSATLVFKIPPARYQEVLGRLGKELGERETLQQNSEDVTEQVADVAARLKNAEQALATLRTVLTQAKTIGQVLEVEREINSREGELESLQARQKALASQVSMATLTLRLIGPVAPAVVEPDEPGGFFDGLRSGWNGLVGFVRVTLNVVGVLLPWLIVIVPLAVIALIALRRNRARRPAPPAQPQPASLDPEHPSPAHPGTAQPTAMQSEPAQAQPTQAEPTQAEPEDRPAAQPRTGVSG